jgi:BirA family biotin operon repressor/biotin-[acetyl-CoA-carboxylase] ligase
MVADSLSPVSISSNLATRFIGQKVIYYPRLASTMDMARREAQREAAEGTVVLAGEQTAGRGRLKRVWLSPEGNIALSIILYPEVIYLSSLVMLASLAVVHAVEEITGLKAQIKWPNDVLINDKKISGILIESDVRGDRVAYAIIGIGINLNSRLSDFPEILPGATSIADELGAEVSRVAMIRGLLAEAEKLYLTLPVGDSVYREWRDRLVTLGKKVRVKSGDTVLEGIAESVAEDGELLLRHANGGTTTVVAGDVSLRDDD